MTVVNEHGFSIIEAIFAIVRVAILAAVVNIELAWSFPILSILDHCATRSKRANIAIHNVLVLSLVRDVLVLAILMFIVGGKNSFGDDEGFISDRRSLMNRHQLAFKNRITSKSSNDNLTYLVLMFLVSFSPNFL